MSIIFDELIGKVKIIIAYAYAICWPNDRCHFEMTNNLQVICFGKF